MKILVDKLPITPAECPFVTWNCEYGYLCSFKIGKLRDRKAVFCKDTAQCPWLKSPVEEEQT